MSSKYTFLLLVTFLGHGIYGREGKKDNADDHQEEATQIYSTIFHKYNEKVRPPDNYPGPVLVTVDATLHHIRSLDIYKREMESLIDLKIGWRDKRLGWYPYQVTEILANVSTVWSPEVVYTNGAVPPRSMFKPRVSIQSNGQLTWQRREAIITMCDTDLMKMEQKCAISLGIMSAADTEYFSNDTSFIIADKFDNHLWNITDYDTERESETEVDFVLKLKPLELPTADQMKGGRNSSYTLPATRTGSDSNGGSDVRSQSFFQLFMCVAAVVMLKVSL